jgi:hypothetical protein
MALAGGPIADIVIDMAISTPRAGPSADFNVDMQPVARGGGTITDFHVDIQPVDRGAGPVTDFFADIGLGRGGPVFDGAVDMSPSYCGGPVVDHKLSFLLIIDGGPIFDHVVEYCPLIIPLNPAFVNPPQLLIPAKLVQGSVGTGFDGLSAGTYGTEFLGAAGQGAGPTTDPDEGD